MRGFEMVSSASPIWIGLTRDLIATAATPLDLSVDRFNDLLVLASTVVSDAVEKPGSQRLTVAVQVDDERIAVSVTSHGEPGRTQRPVSDAALTVLADERWSLESDDASQVGFAINA
jgi:hypothetical protein